MPRQYRLSRSDFAALQKLKPHRFPGKFVNLAVYKAQTSIKGPKFGLVVAKKIIPKATERNKIERKCREIARPLMARIDSQHILVCTVKKEAREADFSALQKDISSLFGRL
jgi:ribonuclease P protein component